MNKRYVIIGGTSGIGKEIVRLLDEKNELVFIGSRKEEAHLKSRWSFCDVLDEAPSFPQVDGPIDGLVYSVGTIQLKPFRQLKIEDFLKDLHLNFLGAIKTIQHYIPNLLLAERASVVGFSTVAVEQGMTYHASIASAKGALEGLFRSLAAEYCPKVRFNLIAPSLTDTPLAANLLNSEAKREMAAKREPLQRVGTPKEIAEAAVFLLSDSSSWTTGQVFHIDGGLSTLKLFQ